MIRKLNKKRLEKKKILILNPEELIIKNKLLDLHKNLKLDFGSFLDEFPEQMMAVRYLKGDEKVLEIGGNIGRNSLIIASILNSNNFVSLECDYDISNQLKHNKEKNNLNFYIENSALSKRKLIQKGWDTIPSEEVLEGYKPVNIISVEELNNKYNINFDTLVVDCEGAFYYILIDMPEILNNIKLIVMENDYWDINKYNYVNNKLKENNFILDYFEKGGWGPCENNFFEVWKKI
jgi:FkbM family methyltransferase